MPTPAKRRCVAAAIPFALAGALTLGLAGLPAGAQTTVDFPLGLRQIPTYDRVDGLSFPVAPTIGVGPRLTLEPVLTYRSNLGKVDPFLRASFDVRGDSALAVRLTASRGTFSNDTWIRSDLVNSLLSIGLGRDARNYFRGDRVEGRVTARLPVPDDVVASAFVGGLFENDWSTGWRPGEQRGPFSFFGRNDSVNGIDRPNPEIGRGHIASALAGGTLEFAGERTVLRTALKLEAAPSSVTGRFEQLTLDGHLGLPTFRRERLEFNGHLVASAGVTPVQRYAYLGGSGTLATLDLLQLGGDDLFFFDTWYVFPIAGVSVPVLGELFVAPRIAAGAASVNGFGRVTQNVGLRFGAGLVEVDVVVNPRTHQRSAGAGISFGR